MITKIVAITYVIAMLVTNTIIPHNVQNMRVQYGTVKSSAVVLYNEQPVAVILAEYGEYSLIWAVGHDDHEPELILVLAGKDWELSPDGLLNGWPPEGDYGIILDFAEFFEKFGGPDGFRFLQELLEPVG